VPDGRRRLGSGSPESVWGRRSPFQGDFRDGSEVAGW
jgi:hypothetical protein